MAETTQRLAQIAGDGAHVAALAAGHLQHDMIGIRAIQHHQLLDPERAGFDLEILAVAGQFIGALAVDLDGGELGRDLHDVANESVQRFLDLVVVGRASLAAITSPSASSVLVA